jgi:hypothetical protein
MTNDLNDDLDVPDEELIPPPPAPSWAREIARELNPIAAAERRLEEARRWRVEVEHALAEEVDPE